MPHTSVPPLNPLIAALGASLLLTACGQGAGPESTASPAGDATVSEGSPQAATPPPDTPPPSDGAPAETSGALPLTPGVYVSPGEDCARPANAGFRIYDGRGISGSATRECRLTVVSTQGAAREIDQSCVDTYSGQRTTTRQTIRIPDARSFTQTEAGHASTFRLCPAGEAPSYLQEMATKG